MTCHTGTSDGTNDFMSTEFVEMTIQRAREEDRAGMKQSKVDNDMRLE